MGFRSLVSDAWNAATVSGQLPPGQALSSSWRGVAWWWCWGGGAVRDWLHTKALILVYAHSSDLSRQTSNNVTSRLRITHGRIVMAELAVAMLITNRPNMTVWAFAQNGKQK